MTTAFNGWRIAFFGASGTGKTTLAEYFSERYDWPLNPVGSRSVAADMGFASPYDVDAAGRREEFQRKLMQTKAVWERSMTEFITDRTTLDNLVYTILHDVRSISAEDYRLAWRAMDNYTHLVYCPVSAVCKIGGDSARVNDEIYQEIYDQVIHGILLKSGKPFLTLDMTDLEDRKAAIEEYIKVLHDRCGQRKGPFPHNCEAKT